jgi:hypothetical protein
MLSACAILISLIENFDLHIKIPNRRQHLNRSKEELLRYIVAIRQHVEGQELFLRHVGRHRYTTVSTSSSSFCTSNMSRN